MDRLVDLQEYFSGRLAPVDHLGDPDPRSLFGGLAVGIDPLLVQGPEGRAQADQ
jgi:hypothetical protein